MPEITYLVTEEWSDNLTPDQIRKWAAYEDDSLKSARQKAFAQACRKWVAENPEYPDGTIVVAEINGSTAVLEQVEGEWWYAETAEALGELCTPPVDVVRILHTPPTIRDHLHAIGLDDEAIRQVNGGYTASISRNVIRACEEAEGL